MARKPAEFQDAMRWNAPDWDDHAEVAEHWHEALTAEACADTTTSIARRGPPRPQSVTV